MSVCMTTVNTEIQPSGTCMYIHSCYTFDLRSVDVVKGVVRDRIKGWISGGASRCGYM